MRTISGRQLAITFVPSLLLLAIVIVMRVRFDVPVSFMTGDIAGSAGLHPLTGFLSTLGILLWCAGASCCYLAAAMLRGGETRATSRFLLWSAVLTSYLLLDDAFMIHDYLVSSETLTAIALGVAVIVYFLTFRNAIAETNYGMLVLATVLLASSLLIDQLITDRTHVNGSYFAEDSAKWLGIACWCSYYTRTSYQLVINRMKGPALIAGECDDR